MVATPQNVEMEAAKFLHKLIQESTNEPTKLATKLHVILQHMRSSGKENSMPYQVISRAMETVINRHALDMEALMSSRPPLSSGTQPGDSSLSQIAGPSQQTAVENDSKKPLATEDTAKIATFSKSLHGSSSAGHDIYQGSANQLNYMSTGGDEEHLSSRLSSKATVWDYFEKITGDDGLPKTRCITCKKVYSHAPNSGTSTMRRHLRKCCSQARSSDELNDDRALKKLKYVIEDNLQTKTDRELMEFNWINNRNIGLLEQKLPDKAIAIKLAFKCYEDEIDRRAKLQRPKENSSGVEIKFEPDDELAAESENSSEKRAESGSAVEGDTTGTHTDVNQRVDLAPSTRIRISPLLENGNVLLKVGVGDAVPEKEHAGRLAIVAIHGDENQQASAEDACAELRKVSSVLSLVTSPNSFYTPCDNPLDEKAEQAKQSLIQVLKKDLETLVGSPDEETVKSCVEILTKILDKLPRFQGRVIEILHTEFESACRNWTHWDKTIQANIAFDVKQRGNLEVLQEWQEKDTEIDSKIVQVDADIGRLKAELWEKERSRESLVKRKLDLFDGSKISMDDAKKVLEEMVTVKLRTDVAIDNMKHLAIKWERIRESFLFK